MVNPPVPQGSVTLRPLTDDNRAALEALTVSPLQAAYVSSVGDSLREAGEHPGAHPILFGLYDGDTPIGFVMIADEVEDPSYVAHYLWKLLIDERYQRRGYGTAALDLVAGYFRSRGVGSMWTSSADGEGSPIPFYERNGFVREGEEHEGEVLLRRDLG